MPDDASLYELAGRCLEAAQQMEFFVSTALMAADGLRTGSHNGVRDAEYVKLVSNLDRLTLGRALNDLADRVPQLLGCESTLQIALEARNRLAHQVFAGRPTAELADREIGELMSELQNIKLDLEAGHRAAFAIARALVKESISAKVALLLPVPPSAE